MGHTHQSRCASGASLAIMEAGGGPPVLLASRCAVQRGALCQADVRSSPTSLSASCALWGAPPGLCWASLTVCTVELMYLDHCLLPPVLRHLGPQSGTASYAYGFG